ncbi:MAG: DUF2905 domain-containing protein [Polyangiaceae bacterium]
MARGLIVIGLAIALLGVLWPWVSKLPLGRLPGDLHIERANGSFHFPLVTCLLVSIVVSLLLYLFARNR